MPICQLSNKENPNTEKTKDYYKTEYKQILANW
jgi:hypothetical protein